MYPRIFFICFALICNFAAYCDESEKPIPQIKLSAQATIQRPPDEFRLSIGVITLSTTAEKALAENSDKMRSVISNLEGIGITHDDYQTGRFSIQPTYTPYPKNPPPDWRPTITGYEVTNTIAIKTGKLKLAGQIIDAANKAGANSIDQINFGLKDSRTYWDEAISAATTNAITDAKVMASAAGVKLVRIISLSLDNTHTVFPRSFAYAKTMAVESAPPIESGDVTISANVSVAFEISQ